MTVFKEKYFLQIASHKKTFQEKQAHHRVPMVKTNQMIHVVTSNDQVKSFTPCKGHFMNLPRYVMMHIDGRTLTTRTQSHLPHVCIFLESLAMWLVVLPEK